MFGSKCGGVCHYDSRSTCLHGTSVLDKCRALQCDSSYHIGEQPGTAWTDHFPELRTWHRNVKQQENKQFLVQFVRLRRKLKNSRRRWKRKIGKRNTNSIPEVSRRKVDCRTNGLQHASRKKRKAKGFQPATCFKGAGGEATC